MRVALFYSPISGRPALGVKAASVGSFRDEEGDGLLASLLDSPMKGCFIEEVGHVREKPLAKEKREEASILPKSSEMKRRSPVNRVAMNVRDELGHLLLTERVFNDRAYHGSPRGHPGVDKYGVRAPSLVCQRYLKEFRKASPKLGVARSKGIFKLSCGFGGTFCPQ